MAKLPSFPSGFQYQEAVQHPDRCFSDSDLRSASFERMAMGLPKMISGNFAAVFPMTSASGHKYAVKCFTRRVSHQMQRYERISARLSTLKPWWATDFQYIPQGIQVEASPYPVLRMNWVNGCTLTHWISQHTNRPAAITKLAHCFDEMVHDLSSSGLAHGDLQAGNLLVTDDGQLHLVDYDGMYVPGLEGLSPDEVGHPDYQPPSRCQNDYGPAMDRFSAWLISLSLKILAAAPELWDQLNPAHDEYLLLDRHDFLELNSSSRLSALCSHQDGEVRRLAQVTRQVLSLPPAAIPALAVPSPSAGRTTAASPTTAPGGIPRWMRSHLTEPAGSPAEPEAQEPARHSQRHDRWLSWLVRALIALPLIAFAGAGDWRLGLAIFFTLVFLVTTALWLLYRRDPLTSRYPELARARRKAVSGARQTSGRISSVQRQIAAAERAEERLVNRHTKEQVSLKADFDRRQQKAPDETGSIADQMADLQRELNAAQIDMDKRHQADRISLDQRRTALAAQLGQAHSDHLAAQELVLDRESRLASAGRPTFGRFVSSAVRGRASERGQWPFRVKAAACCCRRCRRCRRSVAPCAAAAVFAGAEVLRGRRGLSRRGR